MIAAATTVDHSDAGVLASSDASAPGDGNGTEAVLRAVDGLMAGMVLKAAPIRFDLARSDAERDAVYRLRYGIAVANGWTGPDAFPDGRETDVHDADAIHVVGWVDDELAATSRLVFPRDGRRLPTEEEFEIEVEPRGKVVNVDRLAVAPAYRDRRHRAMLGVMGATWQQTRAHGCHAWLGISTASMARLFGLLGFATTPLAPPKLYWGAERVPLLSDATKDAARALRGQSGARDDTLHHRTGGGHR